MCKLWTNTFSTGESLSCRLWHFVCLSVSVCHTFWRNDNASGVKHYSSFLLLPSVCPSVRLSGWSNHCRQIHGARQRLTAGQSELGWSVNGQSTISAGTLWCRSQSAVCCPVISQHTCCYHCWSVSHVSATVRRSRHITDSERPASSSSSSLQLHVDHIKHNDEQKWQEFTPINNNHNNNLLNTWECVYFVCSLSPPKRRVVRWRNFAHRCACAGHVLGFMSIYLVVTKIMTFFQECVQVRLQFCSDDFRSVGGTVHDMYSRPIPAGWL